MSTHHPFHDFEPPNVQWPAWLAWLVAIVVVMLLLAMYALVQSEDHAYDRRVEVSADIELAAALEAQRLELIDELSGTARAAYKQGWQEALASVESSDRGEAFAHACSRLWQGKQP